jgi:hypothetical protein
MDWSQLFKEVNTQEDPKKTDWGQLFGNLPGNKPPEEPILSSMVPSYGPDLTFSSTKNTPISPDISSFTVPKLKPPNEPLMHEKLNVFRAYENEERVRQDLVKNMVDYSMDQFDNNPVKILTMLETESSIFRPSKNKLNKSLKEKFGENIDNPTFEESATEMQKRAREQMGNNWLQKESQNVENSVEQSFDLKNNKNEALAEGAMAYSFDKGFLTEEDKEKVDINSQLREERGKPFEERDNFKIQSLKTKLDKLGETYTDENGNVIDPQKATPEQQEYLSKVKDFKESYSGIDEDKLKEAYFNTYKFTRAMDDLYDMDVKPWLDEQVKGQAGPTSFGGSVAYMPEDLKNIVDQRREAYAEMGALSKLYLANTSPSDLKKDFGYHAQSSLKNFSVGFFGEKFTAAIQDELGPTGRDMNDAIQKVTASNGLPLSEDMQKNLDKSLFEYVNEGAFMMGGMTPKLMLAGRFVDGIRTIKRLETLYGGLRGGKFALATGVVDHSNIFTKSAALILDSAIEELKLSGLLNFKSGAGTGFVAAGRLTPMLALKNPLANGLFQILWKPATISGAMYLSRAVEGAVASISSYKPFDDIMAERFGDKKELASIPISMLLFGLDGFKRVEPEDYTAMRTMAKEYRRGGDIESADWLDRQLKIYEKADKAMGKVKTYGLSIEDVQKKQQAAADEATGAELAAQELKKQELGLKERIVEPGQAAVVLRNSKMRDETGKPQVYYHKTNAVFNIFSTEKKGQSNVKNIQGLNWFSTDPEFGEGSNTQKRYLNFANPAHVGNAEKLTNKKVKQLEKTNDGITGYVVRDGKRIPVAAAFETRGIVKAESADPFKSSNAEVLRSLANRVRESKIDVSWTGMDAAIKFPYQDQAMNLVKEGMAKMLEAGANITEAIAKSIAEFKDSKFFKSLDPETQARFDPKYFGKRLNTMIEELKPGAIAEHDLSTAQKMEKEIKGSYLSDFVQKGLKIADELDARFISDIKKPEAIVSKKIRKGLTDVTKVEDALRGTIVVKDPKQIKDVINRLKKEGYSISINKVADKTGRVGIRALKSDGEIGTEIQIHTDETLKAQRDAEALTLQHRDITDVIDTKTVAERKFKSGIADEKTFTDTEDTPLRNTQYAILTAENPGNKPLPPEENAKRNDILIKQLEAAGFKPIPVEGHYGGNPEHSFIVPGMTDAEALEFGKVHGQESVLTPKGILYQDGTKNPGDVTKVDFDPSRKKDYSIINIGGKDIKFYIPIDWDVRKNTRETDMTQAKTLYENAYKDIFSRNLPGSPAQTAQDRAMKALEIPMATQKELKKTWTETKQKLLGELKGKNEEIKAVFNDFVKNMPELSGLNIKLRAGMLKKVNSIDSLKSAKRAIEYFDKIIDNATERYRLVRYEKAYDDIVYKTSESYLTKKNSSGIFENKLGPLGLPLYKELQLIRGDMEGKTWEEGQEKMQEIWDKQQAENGRDLTAEEFNQLTRYSFYGTLSDSNKYELEALEGIKRDLMQVIRTGKKKVAAAKMLKQAALVEFDDNSFGVLTGQGRKPVKLDEKLIANDLPTKFERLKSWFSWPMSASYRSQLDWLSVNDKESLPGHSYLSEVLGGSVVAGRRNNERDDKMIYGEIVDGYKEVFGTKSNRALARKMVDYTKKIHKIKYKNIAGTGEEIKLTIDQAVKKYQEFQDPKLDRSNEAGGYMRDGELTELGQKIVDLLTPEDKAMGDWIIKYNVERLYPFYNPSFQQFNGVDLPFNEKYSTIYVELGNEKSGNADDLLGSIKYMPGTRNGSLITRIQHDKPLRIDIGATEALQAYVHKMNYWKNWTESIQLLKRFTYNKKNQLAIKQNFLNGDMHIRVLKDHIDYFTNKPTDVWKTHSVLGTLKNNFLIAALALKLPVGIKQISAMPAFAEYIPWHLIPKYGIKSFYDWAGDKGNIAVGKKIWDGCGLSERYQFGWDNVITDIMARNLKTIDNRKDWRHTLMFPTKYGDMASVFMGAIPVYRYQYDKALKEYGPGGEKMAEIKALDITDEAITSTQQSGHPEDLSVVQRSGDFFKALTMFMSAPMQYHRKVSAALRNWGAGRGSVKEHIKTLAVYHVLLPGLFQWMSNGFKWDWEDEIWAGVLGNFNNLLAAGDIIEGIENTVRGDSWKVYNVSPLLSTVQEVTKTVQHLPKVHISKKRLTEGFPPVAVDQILEAAKNHRWNMLELGKVIKSASKVIGNATGYPVAGVSDLATGAYDVATGKETGSDWQKALRVLGWTKNAFKDQEPPTEEDLDQVETIVKKDQQNKTIQNQKTGNLPDLFKIN